MEMTEILKFLDGKKTIIIAVAVAGLGAVQVFFPEFEVPAYAWAGLAALGLGFLRVGVSKVLRKVEPPE